MMVSISLVLLGIAMTIFCPCVLFLLWDNYKEREWRRNNPNEHDIMNKPIKRDEDW